MILIYLICLIAIVKLFYSLKKKEVITTKNEVPTKEKDLVITTDNIQKQIEYEKPTKNKWLYPTDEYGKIEKDMVYESKVYRSGIKENKADKEFKIITKKKKRK